MSETSEPVVSGDEARSGGMTRRGMLAGAAWTVPAVVVASAVPAHAFIGLSDEQPPVELTSLQAVCKFSSTKSYHFELVFTNTTTNYYVELYNLELDVVPTSGTDITMPPAPSRVFAPGESYVLVINSYQTENAAAFDLRMRYDWRTSLEADMTPIVTQGEYPVGGGWSDPVGTYQNTPDCSAVKPPYANYNQPGYAAWHPLAG